MKLKTLVAALAAGYAQAALACPVKPPNEILWDPMLKGPARVPTAASNGYPQFAGLTTLNSGSASVTISTAIVNSDSLIMHSMRHNTAQNSGFGAGTRVHSVVSGVSFAVGWSDGLGKGFDSTVMWEIRRNGAS